jgi:Holliday junction resolvase-like predicted endonuclease
MPILFERMENEIESLKAAYRNVAIVGSPPDVGRLREIFIQQVLKNMLPSTVEICSGVLFDAEDKRSNQQDIIIYRRDMPKLSFGEGPQFLFVEGALATIEVKSRIDEQEFNRAMDNIQSVKSLRINRKMGMSWGPAPKEIRCYVFSYDSVEPNTFHTYLNRYTQKTENPYRFDFIAVLDKFNVYKNDGTVFQKQGEYDFITDTASKWTILGLFIHLIANISGFSLFQIDWSKYLIPPDRR